MKNKNTFDLFPHLWGCKSVYRTAAWSTSAHFVFHLSVGRQWHKCDFMWTWQTFRFHLGQTIWHTIWIWWGNWVPNANRLITRFGIFSRRNPPPIMAKLPMCSKGVGFLSSQECNPKIYRENFNTGNLAQNYPKRILFVPRGPLGPWGVPIGPSGVGPWGGHLGTKISIEASYMDRIPVL